MRPISKTACVGGGVIGTSWAVNFAIKGFPVMLCDCSEAALFRAESIVQDHIAAFVQKDILSVEQGSAAQARIHYTTDTARAVQDAELIQENGPDSVELKRSIIAQIENACPPDAIIASSTSNLLISELACGAKHPERMIGAHPFNPPHIIPLVEICKGDATSEETVERAVDFYRRCDKEPVVLQKESIGFIANRLQMALYREAADLVMRGVCDVAAVDTAVTYGPGLRWAALGPNMLYELGGGQNGLEGLLTALKKGGDALIADLASWTAMPDEWPALGQAGVRAEMEAMPEFKGHTSEEIAAFRDAVLITLLKAHQKL